MRGFFENLILGNLAKSLDSGRFGPMLQSIYRAGKGKLTWTAGLLALVFGFASQSGDSAALATIAQVSAGLAGLGLVRKGAHLQPPDLPEALKQGLETGLSATAWLLMTLQGVVWAGESSGAPWALALAGKADMVIMGLTAASGFLATYVSDPPRRPEATPVV